nr:pre-mrna-splicing factor srp1 [Quercus suber]
MCFDASLQISRLLRQNTPYLLFCRGETDRQPEVLGHLGLRSCFIVAAFVQRRPVIRTATWRLVSGGELRLVGTDLEPSYGRLVRCDIPAPRTASSRLFAFVEYESRRDADDAYHEMHNKRMGRDDLLKIEWARTPPSASWRFDAGRGPRDRSPRRGGGGRARSGSPRGGRGGRYDDDREPRSDRDRERDYDRRDRRDRDRTRSPDADRDRDRDRDRDMKDRDRDDEREGDRETRERDYDRENGTNGEDRKDRDEAPAPVAQDDLDTAE